MTEWAQLGEEAAEAVEGYAKNLIPWMPDPYRCPECSVYCDATVTYSRELYEYVDAWECPSCGREFYREGY